MGGISTGSPDSQFTISGKNFPSGQQITVRIDGAEVGTVNVDSTGNLEFVVTTSDAKAGQYEITVEGANAPITIKVDPTQPPVQALNGGGTRFAIPNEGVTLPKTYLPWIGQ